MIERSWQHDTDIPKAKRAVKVFRALSGAAKTAVDEISDNLGVRKKLQEPAPFVGHQ